MRSHLFECFALVGMDVVDLDVINDGAGNGNTAKLLFKLLQKHLAQAKILGKQLDLLDVVSGL